MAAFSFEKEPDISPMSVANTSSRSLNRIGAVKHSRQDLAVLEASGAATLSNRQPPPKVVPYAAPTPWTPRAGSTMVSSSGPLALNPYGDAAENQAQLSPLSRPSNGKTAALDYPEPGYFDSDGRRPSVASVATASSQGSQSSTGRGFNRMKLQAFFGEDPRDRGSPQTQDAILMGSANGGRNSSHSHYRNNSVATNSTGDGRTASPSSRPRTPIPSSEVTPWVYQASEVSPFHFLAPRNPYGLSWDLRGCESTRRQRASVVLWYFKVAEALAVNQS